MKLPYHKVVVCWSNPWGQFQAVQCCDITTSDSHMLPWEHSLTVMDGTRLFQSALNKSVLAQYFVVNGNGNNLIAQIYIQRDSRQQEYSTSHSLCMFPLWWSDGFRSGLFLLPQERWFSYCCSATLGHVPSFVDEGKFLKGVGVGSASIIRGPCHFSPFSHRSLWTQCTNAGVNQNQHLGFSVTTV